MSRRNPYYYAVDIVESIDSIQSYVEGMSLTDFQADPKTQDAVLRNFQVIGEAIRQLSQTIDPNEFSSEIAWQSVIDMRNLIIHEYFWIDIEIVWETIFDYLPSLQKEIRSIKDHYAPE